MRLFRRRPRTITHDEAREVIELLHAISDDLIVARWSIQAMQPEIARLSTIQTQVETLSRYLADIERRVNARTAGSKWIELDEDTFKAEPGDVIPEDQNERLEWLRKKYAKDVERRKKQGGV